MIKTIKEKVKKLFIHLRPIKDDFKFIFSADHDAYDAINFFFLIYYDYCRKYDVINMSFNDFIGNMLSLFGFYIYFYVITHHEIDPLDPRFFKYCAGYIQELITKKEALAEEIHFDI